MNTALKGLSDGRGIAYNISKNTDTPEAFKCTGAE